MKLDFDGFVEWWRENYTHITKEELIEHAKECLINRTANDLIDRFDVLSQYGDNTEPFAKAIESLRKKGGLK